METYGKLPTRLPQGLDRTLVRVNSVELLSEDPTHCDCRVTEVYPIVVKITNIAL